MATIAQLAKRLKEAREELREVRKEIASRHGTVDAPPKPKPRPRPKPRRVVKKA